MDENFDLISLLNIRKPFNKMEGSFILYNAVDEEITGELIIYRKEESDLISNISPRVIGIDEQTAFLQTMYRVNESIDGMLEVIASTTLSGHIEVRPHNRMTGIFELVEATRTKLPLNPIEDSVTRSRQDLTTINYGDMQMMMVGSNSDKEYLESFVNFGNLKEKLQDLDTLETAKLRLFYGGDFKPNTNLELHLPNSKWSEYGITHANKPKSIELVSSEYTVNTVERYIEFNLFKLVEQWLLEDVVNYGLIIRSSDFQTTSFFTRESQESLRPVLEITYIPNTIQSMGRGDINSHLFVWAVGESPLNSYLEVHSDYGLDYRTSHLYVHRKEVPLYEETESYLSISKPDYQGYLRVMINDNDDLLSHLIARQRGEAPPFESHLLISKPELSGQITVKHKFTLDSFLNVIGVGREERESELAVSKPDQASFLNIRAFDVDDMHGFLTVHREEWDDKLAFLSVTRPELSSYLFVRTIDDVDMEGSIEVPHYNNMESNISITREELYGYLDIHVVNWQESFIEVKEKYLLDGYLIVNEVSDLSSTLMVMNNIEVNSMLSVTRESLNGFLYPRVPDDFDFKAYTNIRQRDASDLNSYLFISGGAFPYYFII
ncbi:hypothetical protein BSK59_16350 [Paenibacillus odorifer]|uniref:DNRLRE domain-containing protein n=1 Tax=Paenibacillus odorifer TaxID=189426 RepID=UPI00096EF72C|nr:DNRLRE domain-containing protein [Paenibacillus odorifer]OME54149.1 hypothetical protein BSK59_16350 [Paenibacillus odorifer]